MMELLASASHVDRKRMAIVGFADTLPEDSNDTPEGRARNRRVDIVILNDYALGKEEGRQEIGFTRRRFRSS